MMRRWARAHDLGAPCSRLPRRRPRERRQPLPRLPSPCGTSCLRRAGAKHRCRDRPRARATRACARVDQRELSRLHGPRTRRTQDSRGTEIRASGGANADRVFQRMAEEQELLAMEHAGIAPLLSCAQDLHELCHPSPCANFKRAGAPATPRRSAGLFPRGSP
jgi:hypothetical protein